MAAERVIPLAVALLAAPPPARLPVVTPAAAHMSAEHLARIDGVVERALREKAAPGAVVLIGRRDQIVFRKAYGDRMVGDAKEPMTLDTVFDLASLTKVVATGTSLMTLVERGDVRLSDPVVKLLPEFGAGGGERESVTVEELLTHRAGLPADDPMSLYVGTPREIFARKHRQPLVHGPGSTFLYSDAGFEVLGEIVQRVSGETLDVYAAGHVFEPLGMSDTEFRPNGRGRLPVSRIAPTERHEGRYFRGDVHDPRARALGGVAGHAGVFSTADDLALFCRAFTTGTGGVLSPAAVAAMTRPRYYGDADVRALAWDVDTHFSSSRGDLFPIGSFGHTGWTGTSIWIDPATGVFVIVLSNRNHPDESGNVIQLRGEVASIAAASVEDVAPDDLRRASEAVATRAALRDTGRKLEGKPAAERAAADVHAGVDVLVEERFAPIAGKRVALLTNQTGRTKEGVSTVDVLSSQEARKAGVTLVRLFSPEHGIRGTLDESVGDDKDEKTGLPIRSLYGASRRPSADDLSGLDAVLVDLQDAGVRFYTYLTTLGYVLEAAAKARVSVVVLDRPDPIGATRVDGPIADPDKLSFTAYHEIPLQSGMTIGELALLFNAERHIDASLSVVKMRGYRRDLWYDETGLVWVNPSPNLRSVTEAALYPGVALLETTNVSVGRGTDAPFEQFGAPWLDAARVARTLTARRIPGVRFVPVTFVPVSSTHKGSRCNGVRIDVVDRGALDGVRLGFEIATVLRDQHGADWDRTHFGTLVANAAAMARFERGETAQAIANTWAPSLMEFERRRRPFLLY